MRRDVCVGAARSRLGELGFVAAVAMVSGLAGTASAQTSASWIAPGSGMWMNGANWSGGVIPNNVGGQTFDAELGSVGVPYQVTLGAAVALDDLSITASDATLLLDGGSIAISGVYSSIGTLSAQNGGSLTVGGNASFANGSNVVGLQSLQVDGSVALNGARFENTQSITLNGSTTANGGAAFVNAGSVTFNDNLFLASDDDLELCDTDVNGRGKIRWSGRGDLILDQTASLTIDQGGEFEVTGSGSRVVRGTADSTFGINGLFMTDTSGQVSFTDVAFENTGVVDVVSGTLSTDGVALAGGDQLTTGTWRVRSSGVIDLVGSNVSSIATQVELIGVGSTFSAIDGLNEVAGGGSLAVSDGRGFTTLAGFVVQAGGGLEVGGGSVFDVTGVFGNVQSGELVGGTIDLSGVLNATNAQVSRVSSVFTLNGAGASFMNGGLNALVTVSNVSSIGDLGLVGGASLALDQSLTNEGRVRLGGDSGTSVPTLSVDGDFTQLSSGTLTIFLTGDGSGSLDITGTAFLAGTLEIIVDPSVMLQDGATLTFLTAGFFVGSFDTVTVSGLGEHFELALVFDGNTLFSRVSVVPAPGAAACVALGGVCAMRRRRL